ncbi:uncharacterized protein LOC110038719 [Phalaenopsis equestris]|uniref:uncharacterized protein LOC110038719 n=1 Tax=Phalaenopsis equestris TaxID=78828 RepID=UPI0009E4C07C|nr:uncharacterized protein LOC110038719 [Phalaenopsis equestris]
MVSWVQISYTKVTRELHGGYREYNSDITPLLKAGNVGNPSFASVIPYFYGLPCNRSEAAMETTKPSPATRLGSLTRTVTKIFRHRRTATFSGVFDEESYNQKLKSNLSGFIDSRISTDCNPKEKPKLDESASSSSSGNNRNELELQVAESPYDPDTIQASDQAVVSELKHLSMLKQSYLKSPKQLETLSSPADSQTEFADGFPGRLHRCVYGGAGFQGGENFDPMRGVRIGGREAKWRVQMISRPN